MRTNTTAPTIVTCELCDEKTVWLRMVSGAWRLFNATMELTRDTSEGNHFAIEQRSRLVIDLDDELEARWPVKCLTLHKYRCPESFSGRR